MDAFRCRNATVGKESQDFYPLPQQLEEEPYAVYLQG